MRTNYSLLTKEEKLEKFLQAVELAFSKMDTTSFWPASAAQIDASFCDLLAVAVFERFKKDRQVFTRALSQVEAELLRTFLICSGIIGLKVAKLYEGYSLSTAEFEDFVVAILDSIASRRKGDEFCLKGTNPALSPQEIQHLLKEKGWQQAKNSRIRRAIARLNVTLESFTWTLFYDIYRYAGMVIHGPYITSQGVLLCRNFFNLNPPLWQIDNQYPTIDVYLIYEKGTKITIDFANHQFYPTPIVDKLRFWRVSSPRQRFESLAAIEELESYFSQLREKQAKRVESLKPLEIIKKGAEINYFMLKEFFAFYGDDWRPPKKVYERIERFGMKYWKRFAKMKMPHTGSWARKAFDPRTDFIS